MSTDGSMARRVFSSSDKCDFVLRGETRHRPGEELAERVDFEAGLRRFRVGASSDKCDWRVSTVPLSREGEPGLSTEVAFEKGEWSVQTDIPSGRVHVASDKCDWSMRVEELAQPAEELRIATAPIGMTAELRRGPQSDKCDWRMVVGDADREIEASIQGKGLSAAIHGPRLDGRIESSKCDWAMKGLATGVSIPPQVEAVASSSKCDVSIQIRFGTAGGRGFRIEAIRAASDKCDFRLKPIEVSDDWTTWKAYTEPSSGEVP
jgi:hypothetical protein